VKGSLEGAVGRVALLRGESQKRQTFSRKNPGPKGVELKEKLFHRKKEL